MQIEPVRAYLNDKPGASEEIPFGPDVFVYKVRGKIFALLAWSAAPLEISLKCEPDFALALRDQYQAVRPGYHLNKKHWNTITLDDSIPEAEIWSLVDHSYTLVVKSLPKADQQQLV
jgi:predicted DNA-binding protein (MmcQ/YjbR family)